MRPSLCRRVLCQPLSVTTVSARAKYFLSDHFLSDKVEHFTEAVIREMTQFSLLSTGP
jgi:hypothetical protein